MTKDEMKYMRCCDGQFFLYGKPLGNSISVKIQDVKYMLLKWENRKVVGSKNYTMGNRIPQGYSLSAELYVLFNEEWAFLTVYEQVILNFLNPYLEDVAWGPVLLKDLVTHMTCTVEGGRNQIVFKSEVV